MGRERGILKPGRNTKLEGGKKKVGPRSGNRLDFFFAQSQLEEKRLEIDKAVATQTFDQPPTSTKTLPEAQRTQGIESIT